MIYEPVYETRYYTVCDACGSKWYNRNDLYNHVVAMHPGGTTTTSGAEDVQTGTKPRYVEHEAWDEDPYFQCSKCGKIR